MDHRASRDHIALKLIAAGKPPQHAFIERFKGKFRDERLTDSTTWRTPVRSESAWQRAG